MRLFESVPPSRRLLALFLILTIAPAAGLAWLGWRLLEQDRALEAQRALERQEYATDLVAGALSRRIATSRSQLTQSSDVSSPAATPDAVVVTFQQDGLRDTPAGRLLYYPAVFQDREVPEAQFQEGQKLEFNHRDYAKAIEQFRGFANSKDIALRTAAQFRIARNERKLGNLRQALAAYEKLIGVDGVSIAGVPAGLAARQARCVLLEEMGRKEDLRREAGALLDDLLNGRFRLIRPVFQLHAEQVCRWLGRSNIAEPSRLALSAAAEWLWQEWQKARSGGASVADTTTVRLLDRSLTILSNITPEGLSALIAGPRYVETEWLFPAKQMIPATRFSVLLRDAAGNAVNNIAPAQSGRLSMRLASDTGLPWTVVASIASPAESESFASRRRLLLAGLALAAVLVITTGYTLTRSLSHELDIARLKSEFVAAVSHEFRTPLATLRQLTENLADGRVSTDERRSAYYQTQQRATNRLSRLVERLLDFGRMEAGALRYHFELLNLGRLIGDVVDEFENVASTSGHQIMVAVDPDLPEVHADPEALGQALWNLLDNAIKYSPGKEAVRVEVAREGDFAAIRIRDDGLGIAPQEQKQLFRKFFRGSAASSAHVKGAGIGLAMVDYIVRAHRGRIRVESEPGKGSAFTILLKLEAS
ncbi:MAG: yycG 2 [Acidobacteria bacterium]|nr:yycG 2 [Acidobacteriota bacterium]